MAIPDFQSLMLPVLQCVSDGKEHPIREIIEKCGNIFQLTTEERGDLLSSGQRRFDNRIYWAQIYLKKSGLITSPSRGIVQITERGEDVLNQKPDKIDMNFLKQFPEYLEFKKFTPKKKKPEGIDNASSNEHLTPKEILEASYSEMRNELSLELLEQIKKSPPEFFERLVIDLLLAMGYGGSRKDAGETTRPTADDGIDGIIKEDKLGLNIVAIQAKRWETTVGRPQIQAFVGSLAGNQVKKGVFITTSQFSKEAKDYVKRIEQKVVLIDGEQLTQYMIDHNLGVSEESSYILKKMDYDYFEDT